MVWGLNWFGGSSKSSRDGNNDSSHASESIDEESIRTSGAEPSVDNVADAPEALSAKDVNPAARKREKLSTKVPLLNKGMPETLIEARPGLRLSEYDLERGMYCANVLALCHNAVRREIVDWEVDIIAGMERLVERESAEGNECGMEVVAVATKLGMWWTGFARLVLCVSLVDEMVVKKSFEDIYVGFGKETRDIEKAYRKCLEKNEVYLETAIRRVDNTMKDLEDIREDANVRELLQEARRMWEFFVSMLLEMYTGSEMLVRSIDKFIREPIEYEDLEKDAAKIFMSKKKWGEDSDRKRGELLILLTRWMGDESFMRRWATDKLSKKEAKRFEVWMMDYRAGRSALVDNFHQLRLQ